MPKSTFLNLPEDKRERIVEAAIDEFAEYTYHKASITRIVKRADIAKGSFYQYFEDKNDLFKYIINLSGEKKLKYLTNVMANIGQLDFFQILRELYVGGVKFAKEHPRLSSIANEFIKNSNSKLKEEILGKNIPKSNQLFEGLLSQGIQKGDINPSIDVEIVSYLLTTMSVSIGEYFIKEAKAEDDMELMTLVDKMLYVIENGIRKKG